MLSRKILLSVISIVAAFAMAGGATYAYFTSTQTIGNNVISSGTLAINAILENTLGNSDTFSQGSMAPGDSYTRCLFVYNDGSVAGRFKIYNSAESGDLSLGNGLSISKVVMNPTDGDCSGIANPTGKSSLYGPNDYTITSLSNIPVRGDFQSVANTPFKIAKESQAMPGGYYAVYAVTVTLDSAYSEQGKSYAANLTVLGMQDAGSDTSTNW